MSSSMMHVANSFGGFPLYANSLWVNLKVNKLDRQTEK